MPANKNERQSVYIIHNPTFGMVKIGISKHVSKRLKELQDASGCKLELSYKSPLFSNASSVEISIHKNFTKDRSYGEWFTTALQEVLDCTHEMCKAGIVDDRVEMYINGESISSMAKKTGVSRQAIISYLRYYDSYKSGLDALDYKRDVAIKKAESPLDDPGGKITKVPIVDFTKMGNKLVRVADNLYANQDGYLVKYWDNGGFTEKRYQDRGSLLKDYKIKG